MSDMIFLEKTSEKKPLILFEGRLVLYEIRCNQCHRAIGYTRWRPRGRLNPHYCIDCVLAYRITDNKPGFDPTLG